MIYLFVLIPWECLAVISLATDGIDIYRTLTGRSGEAALSREIAERQGGMRGQVVINLVLDVFEPWLIWQIMLLLAGNG